MPYQMEVLDVILLATMACHLALCPYTKVEESFNMQALHDILYHQLDITKYDHHEFPGVVPRSFLGSLFVAVLSTPLIFIARLSKLDKFTSQLIVRAMLGTIVCLCLLRYKRAVKRAFSTGTAWTMVLLTITQFHLLFYTSRSLPNTFALAPVLLASAYWLEQRYTPFIWLTALAAVVFRAEAAILLGLMALYDLALSRTLSFRHLIVQGALAGGCWLVLTVAVDSILWRRWLWPEGEVLWFNTILNKSSDWGTSPFLWYFYSALPRAMLFTYFLVPVGLFVERRSLRVFVPAVAFVLLYSLLPHKELRFIVYVVPLLNTVAAPLCDVTDIHRTFARLRKLVAPYIGSGKKPSALSRAFRAIGMCCVLHLVVNTVFTGVFLTAAYHNYPGGVALTHLHSVEPPTAGVNVHIDVYCAQNGITRFGQLNDAWRYDKTEDLTVDQIISAGYSHLMIGVPSGEYMPVLKPFMQAYNVQFNVTAFHSISLKPSTFPPVSVTTTPRVFVLKRKL